MITRPITIAELTTFRRAAAKVWSDDELAEFVDYIAWHPEDGEIIQETGGLRKVRWSRQGSGKRGGVRVIYYYYDDENPLFLITVYPKSAREDISAAEKKVFADLVAQLKTAFRHRGVAHD